MTFNINMEKQYIVGKNGNQPFPITDTKVSRQHLKVTKIGKGKYQIEDNDSTNGTYINGVRVVKKVVDADTPIQLGTNFVFCCNMLAKKADPLDAKFVEEFNKLEKVYNDYETERIKLQKTNSKIMLLRMLPMTLSGIVTAVVPFIPVRIVFGVITLFLLVWQFAMSDKNPEKQKKLKDDFEMNYRCPNLQCRQPLTNRSFAFLKDQGYCPYCKKRWTPENEEDEE